MHFNLKYKGISFLVICLLLYTFRKGFTMPGKKMNRIKDKKQYEALKKTGMSKKKAARIANSPKKKTSKKGGEASKYEEWTKDKLYEKAKKVGIEGRSKMNKSQLINALRNS